MFAGPAGLAQPLSEMHIFQTVTQTVTACYVTAAALVTFKRISTQHFASSDGMCFPSRRVTAPVSVVARCTALVTMLIFAGLNLARSLVHVPGLK